MELNTREKRGGGNSKKKSKKQDERTGTGKKMLNLPEAGGG